MKPCEKPQDLYGEVANLVEKKRAADAVEGNALAKQLEGIHSLSVPFILAKQPMFFMRMYQVMFTMPGEVLILRATNYSSDQCKRSTDSPNCRL